MKRLYFDGDSSSFVDSADKVRKLNTLQGRRSRTICADQSHYHGQKNCEIHIVFYSITHRCSYLCTQRVVNIYDDCDDDDMAIAVYLKAV